MHTYRLTQTEDKKEIHLSFGKIGKKELRKG